MLKPVNALSSDFECIEIRVFLRVIPTRPSVRVNSTIPGYALCVFRPKRVLMHRVWTYYANVIRTRRAVGLLVHFNSKIPGYDLHVFRSKYV